MARTSSSSYRSAEGSSVAVESRYRVGQSSRQLCAYSRRSEEQTSELQSRQYYSFSLHDALPILAWSGNSDVVCPRPCLDGDGCIGCNLSVACDRRWQEPVRQVIDQQREARLQWKVGIV